MLELHTCVIAFAFDGCAHVPTRGSPVGISPQSDAARVSSTIHMSKPTKLVPR